MKGREKEREKNINVWWTLKCPLLGTWLTTKACALGWESNQQPFGSQSSAQSTDPHEPELEFFLLFIYSCPHFPLITLPHLTHPQLSHSVLPSTPLSLSFIYVPWQPFPFIPLLYPSSLPSGYCPFVLYFHVSDSIWLTSLLCWLGSTYRWDHMVFVFHRLVYFT